MAGFRRKKSANSGLVRRSPRTGIWFADLEKQQIVPGGDQVLHESPCFPRVSCRPKDRDIFEIAGGIHRPW